LYSDDIDNDGADINNDGDDIDNYGDDIDSNIFILICHKIIEKPTEL
jgi:hypothetical protein